METQEQGWTEEDSATYQKLAVVAVPEREEQIATLVSLLPFDREAAFTAVELGSGEGYLSEVVLECFPNASVLALDGSAEMRSVASERLSRFGERFKIEEFDILDLGWIERVHGADCVISSLCVHHLDGEGKRAMFQGVFEQLTPGGALIIADLVDPQRPEALDLFAQTWDRETQRRSQERLGNDDGMRAFQETEWNLFRHPDAMDRPSPLFDQLLWLREAGFEAVDCFWLRAGHAIYGGYKPGGAPPAELVGFEAALAVTNRVLKIGKP